MDCGDSAEVRSVSWFFRSGISASGGIWVLLKAELDDFAYALHQCVESFGLRVATAQGGDSGDVVAVFVLLDDHGKFALRLHEDDV